jgi:hypothetical protein
MRPLQCAAGVLGPELVVAAAGLGRWFVEVAVLPVCGDFQRRRQHSATTAHRAVPVCEWPALSTAITAFFEKKKKSIPFILPLRLIEREGKDSSIGQGGRIN